MRHLPFNVATVRQEVVEHFKARSRFQVAEPHDVAVVRS